MRLRTPAICQTCGHRQQDHIGGRSRCQNPKGCNEECTAYKAPTRNKYGNVRIGGADSKLEAERFAELRLMEKAGVIRNLQIHPVLEVQPEGCERITYKPDAMYQERHRHPVGCWCDGPHYRLVIEDSKSKITETALWRVKWKLCRWRFPEAALRISERQRGWGKRIVVHDTQRGAA